MKIIFLVLLQSLSNKRCLHSCLPVSLILMKYKIYLCLAILFLVPAWVKADKVTKAYKKLLKNRFEQSRELLDKSLEKNARNAGAKYVYTLYFLNPANQLAHLDSAYAYILAAISDYPQTDGKTKKHWNKYGINESTILARKIQIDSLAFRIASDSNRIGSYQYFIDHYPTASHYAEAIERRNAIAFVQAQRQDNYQSYKYFIDTYPDARQANEAKERYNILLFDSQTAAGTIESYENFIALHPQSPFIPLAEQRIFEMFNASHTIKTYHLFIKKYPSSRFVHQAWNWIYFLYKQEHPAENFTKAYPDFYDTAYIHKLIAAEKLTYYPVYEEEKYGFIDANGVLQIPIQYDSIAAHYFCEGVNEDFILVYKRGKVSAIDKTGKQIIDESYEEIEQLEDGLLAVQKEGKQGIYHQSGFRLMLPQYEEVELLDDMFLLLTQNGKKGLATVNGRKLTAIDFDEVSSSGEKLLLFEKNGKYSLLRHDQLLATQVLNPKDTAAFTSGYTGVEWIKKGFIKVYTDSLQAILTTQLTPVIPLTAARIDALPKGWLVNRNGNQQIFTLEGKLLSDSVFTAVTGNADFYAVKLNNSPALLKTNGNWYSDAVFDEVALLGNHLFTGRKKNTLFVYSPSGKLIKLQDTEKVKLQSVPAHPAHSWITLQNKKGKKGILDLNTGTLISPRYDDIQVWQPDLYKTALKGKFGLVNAKGKILIPAIYDGLDYQQGMIATLKNGKFGLMNINRKLIIPPQYSALLRKYDQAGQTFIAARQGKYGLIGTDNKPLSEFIFDEIQFWQNEVALVRQQQTWYLYHIIEKRYIYKPMDDISYIHQSPEEIVLKVYIDKMYGILSNIKGQVINCDYEDLANVGSDTLPLYVGEKYIDDADIYLVFYINREGKSMRRQIFNPSNYQRMLCD